MTIKHDDTSGNKNTPTNLPSRRRATPPEPTSTNLSTLKTADLGPREYNTNTINEFLDIVFHAGLDEEEEIMVWSVTPGKHPSYPKPDHVTLPLLETARKPMALYYGTSTAYKDDAGQVFNRKECFARMFVLVLDDIGTKVDASVFPKGFKPTYIIESSKGNYQYGIVLKEPLEVYEQAAALVQIVYEEGFSDEGGKMPNKLVRLPEGVNGKRGPKRGFVSRLVSMDGPLWEPAELLEVIGIKTAWSEVLDDCSRVLKERAKLAAGTSVWAGGVSAPALNGTVDTVLEWLYEGSEVLQDNGQWVTIHCPWAATHTGPGDTAGYLPLGRGDNPNKRGFHCFHEHCVANGVSEFLQHVAGADGPKAPVNDAGSELVSSWVYNANDSSCWKVKGAAVPKQVQLSSFKELYARKTPCVNAKGNIIHVAQHAIWTHHPGRVIAFGEVYDPTTTARLVTYDDHNYVNRYCPPDWDTHNTPRAEYHIKKFLSFIEYLIPEEDQREFTLDWLGAKAQNMGFRGPALVMVATEQGTGRTTLTDMLEKLFGEQNMTKVPFDLMLSDQPFNEWMMSPLVVTNETLNTGGDRNTFYKAYERLKDIVDPRPQKVVINPKYGKKFTATCHSSYLFMSNHINAIALDANDRRFYVIRNALTPASPEYYADLNIWLNEQNGQGPEWCAPVWKWLNDRQVNIKKLLAPVEMSTIKRQMIMANRSPLDALADAILASWPQPYITNLDLAPLIHAVEVRLNLHNMTGNPEALVKRRINGKVSGYHANVKVFMDRLDGRQQRPKMITSRQAEVPKSMQPGALAKTATLALRVAMNTPVDMKMVIQNINDALDLADL